MTSQRSSAQTSEERPRKRPAKAGRPTDLSKAGQTNGSDPFAWTQRLQRLNQALEGREEFDLVALQEPPINDSLRIRPPPAGEGEALYVSKRIERAAWTAEAGEDWAAVTIDEGTREPITIWSIYLPNYERNWRSPLQELAERELRGRNVLVGDFNAYHSMWDIHNRTSFTAGAVLRLAVGWDLDLYTPRGNQRGSAKDRGMGLSTMRGRRAGPRYGPRARSISQARNTSAADNGLDWGRESRQGLESQPHPKRKDTLPAGPSGIRPAFEEGANEILAQIPRYSVEKAKDDVGYREMGETSQSR
ncbi:hypothetical protein N658DRAFT_487227 [Parathielavia hyrcaniae]|uniref:Endonuclease/exonuclease/phosphatase domain-containing protein n=1 Tax=Parathielavia hyrcaniae TaxID=113614 RepID=A0AAN6PYF3_9PEZI|nr:hypothetical protein N658DRAFT_487227 [Parathielavia hyrcaniae]